MAIDQGQKKTNPSPYDQVIVMSQRFINASFVRMWQEAPYDDPLKLFERTGPRTQDMVKVTFEPPRLFIPAFDYDYPGQIYLRMKVQHKFIMPASGVFAMRHPKFNNRGDLLVELEYLNFNAPNSRAVVPAPHVVDNTTESDHFPFRKISSISQDFPPRQPVDHHHYCLTREHFYEDVYHEYHVDEDEFHGDHHCHPGEHDDEYEDHRPDPFKHTEHKTPDGHTPDERLIQMTILGHTVAHNQAVPNIKIMQVMTTTINLL
ncbi:hypothetical protein CNMCM7691_008531 [Aspergillus felis]|uniref:Uncharacterized protein n=1 Tax=Aspergillus felis TaxID=1287682 RepID=A0A8H6V6A7_9EURO|nr:hypothetical protein CNMCM7691_008531 [Aspergillus felis]